MVFEISLEKRNKKEAESPLFTGVFGFFEMAPQKGLEPSIYRLGGGCVIHYATGAYVFLFCSVNTKLGGKLTVGNDLRRRTLYPAERSGHIHLFHYFNAKRIFCQLCTFGGAVKTTAPLSFMVHTQDIPARRDRNGSPPDRQNC